MEEKLNKIISSVFTNKGEYFVKQNQFGNKFFEKHILGDISAEINGYNMIKNFYKVPQMISFDYDTKTIIYEYIESLNIKTLHYGLFELEDFDFSQIVEILTKNYKNVEYYNENLSQNAEFFVGRIPFISNYLTREDISYDKKIVYLGNKMCSFRDAIKSIIFDLTRDNVVPVAITQGDPTDLNVSIDGYITDFEKAGKNSLVNEVAIFLGCYLANCYYFYIKYMNSPHKLYRDTLEKFKNYIILDFDEEKDSIEIKNLKILPKNVKEFILAYLENVKSINIIPSDFNIGAYVAMRMVSPVNVNTIKEKNDKYILFTLAVLFTEKYKTIDEIIKFIEVV